MAEVTFEGHCAGGRLRNVHLTTLIASCYCSRSSVLCKIYASALMVVLCVCQLPLPGLEHTTSENRTELIHVDSFLRPCLHASKVSKFLLIDHGSLLFADGGHSCHMAISSSCTIAVVKSHAPLCQRHIFTMQRCFREHC